MPSEQAKKRKSLKKAVCLNLRIDKVLSKTDESIQGNWQDRHQIY